MGTAPGLQQASPWAVDQDRYIPQGSRQDPYPTPGDTEGPGRADHTRVIERDRERDKDKRGERQGEVKTMDRRKEQRELQREGQGKDTETGQDTGQALETSPSHMHLHTHAHSHTPASLHTYSEPCP